LVSGIVKVKVSPFLCGAIFGFPDESKAVTGVRVNGVAIKAIVSNAKLSSYEPASPLKRPGTVQIKDRVVSPVPMDP